MKRTRKMFAVMAMVMSMAVTFSGGHNVAFGDAGTRVIAINGISTVQHQCQYIWAQDPVTHQPVRDELGIPKPTTLPPTCRKVGTVEQPCTLRRNMGPYPPPWRAADPTQGEVGLYPPCAGVLTASLEAGSEGCDDASNPGSICKLDAPTWYYGYCAQTYGGDSSTDGVGTPGSMTLNNNQKWVIDRMGFTRGRGIWEFGGKMHLSTNAANTSTFRFYLDAVPNKLPDEGTACDGGPSISSVEFAGTIVMPAPPVKMFRTSPGWHFCADDPNIPNKPQNVEGC